MARTTPLNIPMTVTEMTEMAEEKSGHYRVEGDAQRKKELQRIINLSLAELVNAAHTEKLSLTPDNLPELQQQTALYMKTCAEAGIPPSIESLCLALGYSRSGIYKHQALYPDSPVSEWLEKVTDIFAGIIDNGAMLSHLAPAPAIFRLKSVHSRKESFELVPQNNENLFQPKMTNAEMLKLVESLED